PNQPQGGEQQQQKRGPDPAVLPERGRNFKMQPGRIGFGRKAAVGDFKGIFAGRQPVKTDLVLSPYLMPVLVHTEQAVLVLVAFGKGILKKAELELQQSGLGRQGNTCRSG